MCGECGEGYARRRALKLTKREPLPGELPRELAYGELQAVPPGTVLHWTNWPGKPSRPVTRVDSPDGNITFEGTTIFAMPGDLTWVPKGRAGGARMTAQEQADRIRRDICGSRHAYEATHGRKRELPRDR